LGCQSGLFQLAIDRIIDIAGFLASIEGGAVIRCQWKSALQPARQVGIGNEDTPECDGVGITG
jgi:hypothetical protein